MECEHGYQRGMCLRCGDWLAAARWDEDEATATEWELIEAVATCFLCGADHTADEEYEHGDGICVLRTAEARVRPDAAAE